MSYKFSGSDHLKRDRAIEGETGIDIKIDDGIFFTCLAASDANPRWREKAEKAFAEIKRLRNTGADKRANDHFARLFAETIVVDWHGGVDDDGQPKPGGPRDEAGDPVPFSVQACEAYLIEYDDVLEVLIKIVNDTKNFRISRAKEIVEAAKN